VRIGLAVVGVLVVVLVGAQLLLPGIAARRARDRVARYGTVLSSHVSAVPAIELLWGHGDSGSVLAGSLSLSATQGVDMLWEGRGITDTQLTASSMQVEGVQLRAASVRKRGATVVVEGTMSESDLSGTLPLGLEVHSLTDAGGHVLAQATGSVLGVSATVQVDVHAVEGRLVAEPQGLPLAGLATVTVFSDPRLRMESIDVTPLASTGGPASLRLVLRGTLVGG
jgi:hypothetical protein